METAVNCMPQFTHFLHSSLCRCQRNLNSSPITGKLFELNVWLNDGWIFFLILLFPLQTADACIKLRSNEKCIQHFRDTQKQNSNIRS